jgi:hypothetical protein
MKGEKKIARNLKDDDTFTFADLKEVIISLRLQLKEEVEVIMADVSVDIKDPTELHERAQQIEEAESIEDTFLYIVKKIEKGLMEKINKLNTAN